MDLKGEKASQILDPEALSQLLESRRSTFPRQFSGERIEDGVIHRLLENANSAPTHKRTMPWRFRVFSDGSMHELLEFLKSVYLADTPAEKVKQSKASAYDERKKQCSHIIAISAFIDPSIALPEWEEMSAVACAVQNIYLSLATYGIAGYWSTGSMVESSKVWSFLNLGEQERFMGFFYLGVPAVILPEVKRDPLGKRVEWIGGKI